MVVEVTDERLLDKIRRVRLLILDVDGVMTDGSILFDEAGAESKGFNVRDGHGLKMLMRYGIEVALLTGRRSRAVEHRAADLGIAEIHQGSLNKAETYAEILERRNLAPEETAYAGDDIVDIPVLRQVGFSAAPADAVPEVMKAVDYITGCLGGRGAVRELCEVILKAQGFWAEVAARYRFV